MQIPLLKKSTPYQKSRFGVSLVGIDPYYQKILKDYPLLRDSVKGDFQFVRALFLLAEKERAHKNNNKFYYNIYEDSFSKYDDVLESAKIIDWNCAICGTKIDSTISDFSVENLVCQKCSESHHSKNRIIDRRIVDASILFYEECRRKMVKEQINFMKYMKHFNSGDFLAQRYLEDIY